MDQNSATACKACKSKLIHNAAAMKLVCRDCEKYPCSKCFESKAFQNFSHNQMAKGDERKCRACTGQSTTTLTCGECEKTLPLTLFRRENRSPPLCNECRAEVALEESEGEEEYTGDYVGHGQWDMLTGCDDGSGV